MTGVQTCALPICFEHGEAECPPGFDRCRTLYRGFSSFETEQQKVRWMHRESGRRLGAEALLRFFVQECPLIQEASSAAKAYLAECYAALDLERIGCVSATERG